MGILASIPVEDQGNGFDCIVNAQAFASLVSSMNGPVALAPEGKKGLKVECGSVSVTLKGTTRDLPEFNDPQAKQVLKLTGQDLLELLRVGNSAATDPMLVFSSVLFDISSSETSSWATDSFRAATCLKPVGGEPTSFLLPLAFVSWMRTFPAKATVTISESPNRIVVTAVEDNITISMTTPKGEHQKFPALSSIFDAVFNANGVVFSVEAAALNQAARQVKALGGDTIALYTNGSNLCLRAKTDTAGYNNTIGTVRGEINIFLASGFVADGMSLFETPELLFTGTKSPLAAKEGNLRVLFMPKNVDEKVAAAEEPEQPSSLEAEPVPVEQLEAVAV
jgi:DNA polymerase III sliding clamp (beta) subunit (PCNA family)